MGYFDYSGVKTALQYESRSVIYSYKIIYGTFNVITVLCEIFNVLLPDRDAIFVPEHYLILPKTDVLAHADVQNRIYPFLLQFTH